MGVGGGETISAPRKLLSGGKRCPTDWSAFYIHVHTCPSCCLAVTCWSFCCPEDYSPTPSSKSHIAFPLSADGLALVSQKIKGFRRALGKCSPSSLPHHDLRTCMFCPPSSRSRKPPRGSWSMLLCHPSLSPLAYRHSPAGLVRAALLPALLTSSTPSWIMST